MSKRGVFITFEGWTGRANDPDAPARPAPRGRRLRRIETVEPGGTSDRLKIRRILLDSANQELSPTAELLLYFFRRATQNVDEVILPALAEATDRAVGPLHRFIPGLSGTRGAASAPRRCWRSTGSRAAA